MSNKNRIILSCSILILLLMLSAIYLFIPKVYIEILGNKYAIVNVGETYNDLGAKAYYKNLFKNKEINIEANGTVDTEKLGKYTINYEAKYKQYNKKTERIVEVVDREKPQLLLNDEVKLCKLNGIIVIDASAIDNYDGDISDKVQYNLSNNNVYINVSDSSNNKTEIIEPIKYIDNEKPSIKLNGSSETNLTIGSNYIELGATAYDSCDGDISKNIVITGQVNSNVIGKYEIKYTIKDSMNNEVSKIRTVYVKEKDINNPVTDKAIIYLTFDDGPGSYTEELLNILDKYNVKATFFVTNQLPKYQNLIKLEYEKGHTIGIHTYSHKWSIYESVDTYLNDFEKIKNIVVEQTGVEPKIFRFPGGSSNTVSRKYSKGIMTKLAKLMTEKGYIYYDWTFDSGDTSKNNNSKDAIISNVKRNLKGNGEYVILMHDIKKNTIAALPTIIEYAKSNGYVFATLNENVNPPRFKIAN